VKHLAQLDKEKLFARPSVKANPIMWIFGHIVVSRGSLLELLGSDADILSLKCYFSSGTKPLHNPSEYPHFDEVMKTFGRLGTQLVQQLKINGEAMLSRQGWNGTDTIGKHVIGGYVHEAFHVGQISYLLSLVEKGNVIDPRQAMRRKNSTGKLLVESLKSVLTG